MRYSSNIEDPGYPNWLAAGCVVNVWLDDIPLEDVETADTDEGFAIVCRRDKKGQMIIIDGAIVTMKVVGAIRVEPLP